MNKFLGIALSLILFVSCSFSDDAAGVTTEPNDVIAEETNDLEDKASSSSIATKFSLKNFNTIPNFCKLNKITNNTKMLNLVQSS